MKDSRVIGEAQARCYLSIEAVRAYISEHDGKPRLHVAIRNSGASPALETSWTAELGYTLTDVEGTRRDQRRSAELVRAAVAPGSVFDVPAVQIDFAVSSDERAHLLRRDAWLQLSARISVSATDVFDHPVGTDDFFTGAIHDLDVWFALEATGAKPVRKVGPRAGAESELDVSAHQTTPRGTDP